MKATKASDSFKDYALGVHTGSTSPFCDDSAYIAAVEQIEPEQAAAWFVENVWHNDRRIPTLDEECLFAWVYSNDREEAAKQSWKDGEPTAAELLNMATKWMYAESDVMRKVCEAMVES